ncbi:unnamed protein product [Larinioides sclopetarius]|uniref:Uncharacterized protein n=1 Tax=Larinioides sclopetarius TaxID=280406 RepID=A0AAV1YTR4_9ARAC
MRSAPPIDIRSRADGRRRRRANQWSKDADETGFYLCGDLAPRQSSATFLSPLFFCELFFIVILIAFPLPILPERVDGEMRTESRTHSCQGRQQHVLKNP